MISSNHHSKMIFDIGMHDGTDTDFYLAKGFKVVAIEADPILCNAARNRFADYILSGQLVIIERAVATASGPVNFFQNRSNTQFGTLNASWAERNRALGSPSEQILVQAVRMADVIAEHGVPYYAKIDIEGSDLVAVAGFSSHSKRPSFLSIETSKTSYRAVVKELRTLRNLGYSRFCVVAQHKAIRQRPPFPPLEGAYVDGEFMYATSGLFGKELPGPWHGLLRTMIKFLPILIRHSLIGDDGMIRDKKMRHRLSGLIGKPGWHDLHACHETDLRPLRGDRSVDK